MSDSGVCLKDGALWLEMGSGGIQGFTTEQSTALAEAINIGRTVYISIVNHDGLTVSAMVDSESRARLREHFNDSSPLEEYRRRLESGQVVEFAPPSGRQVCLVGHRGMGFGLAAALELERRHCDLIHYIHGPTPALKYQPDREPYSGFQHHRKNNQRFTPEMKLRNWQVKHGK